MEVHNRQKEQQMPNIEFRKQLVGWGWGARRKHPRTFKELQVIKEGNNS